MIHEGVAVNDRIDAGFLRSVSRKATSQEQAILSQVLETAKQRFAANPVSAQSLNSTGTAAPNPTIDTVELASWTILASTLLNLDETISKR